MNRNFSVALLGTGAADHQWNRYGEPGVRGSAMALLNRSVLIDYGATAEAALNRYAVTPDQLTDLVFTHSHSDHFNPEATARLLAGHPGRLAVHASPEILARLAATVDPAGFTQCPLHPGAGFVAGGMRFTALPANHLLADPEEQAYHYLIEQDQKRLLYALDGAGFTKPEWLLIRNVRLDAMVIDCTMARPGDWRIFEHNDLDTVVHLLKTLRNAKVVDDSTRVVLSHLAYTLWPESSEEAAAIVSGSGLELAFDGMTFEV